MPIRVELSQEEKNYKIQQIIDKYTSTNTLEKPVVPGIVAGYATDKEIKHLAASGVLKYKGGKQCEEDVEDPEDVEGNVMKTDSMFLLWSTTKAFTVTALFQLIERGEVSLADPVEKYLPEFKLKRVIKSMDLATGEMELEELQVKPTLQHLTTHTAGFGYAFSNYYYKKIQEMTGNGEILKADYKQFDNVPLAFQPGSRWEYGTNIDFVGAVVMKVSGLSLEDYFTEHIWNKCGIASMKFNRVAGSADETTLSHLHVRDPKDPTKFLSITKDFTPLKPEFQCGGHGVFGKVEDYLKFLQIFINNGVSPVTGERVLSEETLENHAFKDQLTEMGCQMTDLPGAQEEISNPIAVYPNTQKAWTNFFLINNEEIVETARPKGSLMWCGLANLYYVINLEKKLVMYWAESLFPFADASSFIGFSEFEHFVNTEC